MKIPVFVSCPTTLRSDQQKMRLHITRILDRLGLEPRALGRSDYPSEFPLREVLVIAKKCSGAVVLGFHQSVCTGLEIRPGTKKAKLIRGKSYFPTAWNNLEAGVTFALGLPVLVFREEGVSDGIFDHGVSDVFVHAMPPARISKGANDALFEVFLKWRDKVGSHYYGHPLHPKP